MKVHSEFSLNNTTFTEESVHKMIDYVTKHVNPIKSGREPLRNIITEAFINSEVAELYLNIFENGCLKYNNFREDRIIEKIFLFQRRLNARIFLP